MRMNLPRLILSQLQAALEFFPVRSKILNPGKLFDIFMVSYS